MRFSSAVVLLAATFAAGAASASCGGSARAARLSIPAEGIAAALAGPEGVEFASHLQGPDLWLEVRTYPAALPARVAAQAILLAGRLAAEDFDRLVLADGPEGEFAIDAASLRRIGCRYSGGAEGTANPPGLLDALFAELYDYRSGARLAASPDMTVSLALLNDVVMPRWVFGAIR